jgi:hypothetical protein
MFTKLSFTAFIRFLAFLTGSILILASVFTYAKQQQIVQKKLKHIWAGLHVQKRNWNRFILIFLSLLELLTQKIRDLLLVTFNKLDLLLILTQFVFVTLYITVFFTPLFFETSPLYYVTELLEAMLALIVYGGCYLCIVYLFGETRTYVLVSVSVAMYIYLRPHFALVGSTSLLLLYSFGIMEGLMMFIGMFFGLKSIAMKKWMVLILALFAILIPAGMLFKDISIGTMEVLAASYFEKKTFYHILFKTYYLTIMFYPVICAFIILLTIFLAMLFYLCWLSLTATVRSMFEHAIIKRRRFLLTLGTLLIAYALPEVKILENLKNIVSHLFE